MAKKCMYRVMFLNQGKIYEVYAKRVSQGDLYGFVAVEGITFGEKSSVVIDPSEERLKAEFEGVQTAHVPIHAIIRIDEVAKQGVAKIVAINAKVDDTNSLARQMMPLGELPPGGKPG